jgi:hypothetical protein
MITFGEDYLQTSGESDGQPPPSRYFGFSPIKGVGADDGDDDNAENARQGSSRRFGWLVERVESLM